MVLLQVMVQEYLTRYTRLELLKLLALTTNETFLKLFRQYNGLELLNSYMCDSAPEDWEVKHQVSSSRISSNFVTFDSNQIY